MRPPGRSRAPISCTFNGLPMLAVGAACVVLGLITPASGEDLEKRTGLGAGWARS